MASPASSAGFATPVVIHYAARKSRKAHSVRWFSTLVSLCLLSFFSPAMAHGSVEACMAERDAAEVALIGNMDFRLCIARLAGAKKDRSYCDLLEPNKRENCRAYAADIATGDCLFDDDYDRCMIEGAVEFQSMMICRHGVSDDASSTCKMMVAAEAKDIALIFDEPDLDDEERDALAAQYAVLAKDYSALDYINDDETHDMALIAITVNRIGAGEPVGPTPCNNLSTSSLDSFNRQPFQLDLYAMCVDRIALGKALVSYADQLDEDSLIEIEQMISSMDSFDPETDLSRLPVDMQAAFHQEKARTIAQHKASELPAEDIEIKMPSLATPENYGEEGLTSEDVCILGMC